MSTNGRDPGAHLVRPALAWPALMDISNRKTWPNFLISTHFPPPAVSPHSPQIKLHDYILKKLDVQVNRPYMLGFEVCYELIYQLVKGYIIRFLQNREKYCYTGFPKEIQSQMDWAKEH